MSSRELAPKGALIFDWDDTKVATFRSCLDLYRSFSGAFGLKNPDEQKVRELWGAPLPILIPGLWPEVEQEELMMRFIEHADGIEFCVEPVEGMVETMLKLKEMGYVIGIVSSTPKRGFERTYAKHLSHFPKDNYAFIFTSEDTKVHKPDPKVFDEAFSELEKLGVDSSQVAYIGDGINDYRAARDRGIRFVAVTSGFATRENFIAEGLDERFILESVNELPVWLEENEGLEAWLHV